jgi:Uma2 family endonuclease
MVRRDTIPSGRKEPRMAQPSTLPRVVRGEWIPMSWEAFLEWAPDEGQSEWVDGRGIAHVSNSTPHVRLLIFLTELLGPSLRVFGLGELFVDQMLLRLPARPAGRMPDLFVIGRGDRDRVRHQWVDGPVLLAIELLSEESEGRDLVEKRAEYEQAGIAEYLVIETRPDRQEFVYLSLDAEGRYQPVTPDAEGRFHSAVLPGFWLDPAWFRQDPLPNPLALLKRISPDAWRRLVQEVEAEG